MDAQAQMNKGAHVAHKLIESAKAAEDYDLFFHALKTLPTDEAFRYGFFGQLIDLAIQGSRH
jgi:hypothetical protein